MSKDELRQLYDARRQAEVETDALSAVSTYGLTTDEAFEIDLRYRQALERFGKADRAYKDAADAWVKVTV